MNNKPVYFCQIVFDIYIYIYIYIFQLEYIPRCMYSFLIEFAFVYYFFYHCSPASTPLFPEPFSLSQSHDEKDVKYSLDDRNPNGAMG